LAHHRKFADLDPYSCLGFESGHVQWWHSYKAFSLAHLKKRTEGADWKAVRLEG